MVARAEFCVAAQTLRRCIGLPEVTKTFLTFFLFHTMRAQRGGGLSFFNPPGRSTRMRTQFLYVGLLGMLAGGLSAGCDDIHAGQASDPSGPVKLVRIMVQPAEPFALRKTATDILDTAGSPLSNARACDDQNPCLPQFVFAGANPNFDCVKGVCNDPLAPTAGGVAIGVPEK